MKGENKQQRFTRVAEKRVQNVLDSVRRLSQCSNKRMYEWNDDQLTKIWDAIDTELQNCKESYKGAEPEEFRL
jgi:DNA repair photolyase